MKELVGISWLLCRVLWASVTCGLTLCISVLPLTFSVLVNGSKSVRFKLACGLRWVALFVYSGFSSALSSLLELASKFLCKRDCC